MPPIIDSTGSPLQLIKDYHDTGRVPSQKYLNSENFPELLSDYRNLNGGEIGRIIDRYICEQWQSLTDLAGINMCPDPYLDDDIKDIGSVLYGRKLITKPQNDYCKSAEKLVELYGHRENNHAKAKVLLFCWMFNRTANEFPSRFFDPVFIIPGDPPINPEGKTFTLSWDNLTDEPLNRKILHNPADTPITFQVEGVMLKTPREITLPPQCSFTAFFVGDIMTCLKGTLAVNTEARTAASRYYRTEQSICQMWNYSNCSESRNFLDCHVYPNDFVMTNTGTLVILAGDRVLDFGHDLRKSKWQENIASEDLLGLFSAGRQMLAVKKDGLAVSNVHGVTGTPVLCVVECVDELIIISRDKDKSRRKKLTDEEIAERMLGRFSPVSYGAELITESMYCGNGMFAGITKQGNLTYFRGGN